jgi:hypothetical protein
MNIEAEKISLVKLLLDTEDINVLNQVKKILSKENEKGDFWDELSDAQKEEINLGIKQLDAGEGIPYEEVLKKISK